MNKSTFYDRFSGTVRVRGLNDCRSWSMCLLQWFVFLWNQDYKYKHEESIIRDIKFNFHACFTDNIKWPTSLFPLNSSLLCYILKKQIHSASLNDVWVNIRRKLKNPRLENECAAVMNRGASTEIKSCTNILLYCLLTGCSLW